MRQRGAIATILDDEVLNRYANEKAGGKPPVYQGGIFRQMFLETTQGPAVINSDGVGLTADEGEIIVYLSSAFGIDAVPIPLSIIEKAKTEERIDLADGIRVFGDRLDSNHYTWFSLAKPAA